MEKVVGRANREVVECSYAEDVVEAVDASTELEDGMAEVVELASTALLVVDETLLAVETVALTLTLADVVVEDDAGAEPSQVATAGPGMVYGLPPLSGVPVLP